MLCIIIKKIAFLNILFYLSHIVVFFLLFAMNSSQQSCVKQQHDMIPLDDQQKQTTKSQDHHVVIQLDVQPQIPTSTLPCTTPATSTNPSANEKNADKINASRVYANPSAQDVARFNRNPAELTSKPDEPQNAIARYRRLHKNLEKNLKICGPFKCVVVAFCMMLYFIIVEPFACVWDILILILLCIYKVICGC